MRHFNWWRSRQPGDWSWQVRIGPISANYAHGHAFSVIVWRHWLKAPDADD